MQCIFNCEFIVALVDTAHLFCPLIIVDSGSAALGKSKKQVNG